MPYSPVWSYNTRPKPAVDVEVQVPMSMYPEFGDDGLSTTYDPHKIFAVAMPDPWSIQMAVTQHRICGIANYNKIRPTCDNMPAIRHLWHDIYGYMSRGVANINNMIIATAQPARVFSIIATILATEVNISSCRVLLCPIFSFILTISFLNRSTSPYRRGGITLKAWRRWCRRTVAWPACYR